MAHVAPQLEGQGVTNSRHVVVGSQQHPVAVGRHTQQFGIQLLALLVNQLDGVLLLVEAQRTVATQFDADKPIVVTRLHVGCHLLPGIQLLVYGNDHLFDSSIHHPFVTPMNHGCSEYHKRY